MLRDVELSINGEKHQVSIRPDELLVDTLRKKLGLTGTKKGCGTGECGSCTILLDGKAVHSCLLLTSKVVGREVMTIEGLGEFDKLHPLQDKFKDMHALQCGFCGPGMLMSSKALLDKNIDPTEQEIREALAGNLCRCTGHVNIIKAVQAAAADLRKGKEE